jgi:quercetin dioxygenase-like cupin family protein
VDARLVAVVGGAVVVGVAFGIAVDRLWDEEPDARPELIGEGTLASLPRGSVSVRAETVVLPAGFESRHFHGGPTFNFVEAGSVAITNEGQRVVHDEGGFFFEPARRPHTIRVLEDATLRVVRLLPPGAAATTELGG